MAIHKGVRSIGSGTATVVAALALAVALTGCAAINVFGNSSGDPERDSETQEITSAGQADVFSIKVGDCLHAVQNDTVEAVPVVPCGDPHDEEVFAEFSLPDAEWPGRDAIDAAATEQCGPAFREFVGLPWEESALNWYPLTPTEQGWAEVGDRLVQCVIYDPAGKVSGSLQAAGR